MCKIEHMSVLIKRRFNIKIVSLFTLISFLASLSLYSCSYSPSRVKTLQVAPSINALTPVTPPPEVPSKLLDPHYWVLKLSEPDKVIMTQDEIEYFNDRALGIGRGINIFSLPDVLPASEVTGEILETAELSSSSNPLRYDRNDNLLTEQFYYNLLDKLNLEATAPEVEVRYALVINRTDVLAWPVDELIMSKPYDYEFNTLQQSALYIGTPIAVFHTSGDGRWVFIRTPYFDGWVKEKDLAWTSREEAASYPGSRFLVVIDTSVRTASGINLLMGTQVPLVKTSPKGYEVKIPTRGSRGELVFLDDFFALRGG